MVKLTQYWEGPPDHHDRESTKLLQRCSSVEGETLRAVVQRVKPDSQAAMQNTTGIGGEV